MDASQQPNTGRVVAVPTADELVRAREVVRSHLGPTPVVETPDFVLKLECFQPTGSFKVRGAIAAIAALPESMRAAGVVTASAGNAGLGVAFAATRFGIPATIVAPVNASPAKVAALREFPISLVLHGDGYSAAERHALDLAEGGARYVSAYNDTWVIAGQASLGEELLEQAGGAMTIVAPVGGGGLVAGLALWASGHPDVRVVGVEAEASRAVSAAIAAGRVVELPVRPTIADGLVGNIEPNSITPSIIGAHVDAIVAVSEAQIRQAMRFLASRHGLLVEGSAAVGVAALHAGIVDVVGRPVCVVTGRNIALSTAAQVLADDEP